MSNAGFRFGYPKNKIWLKKKIQCKKMGLVPEGSVFETVLIWPRGVVFMSVDEINSSLVFRSRCIGKFFLLIISYDRIFMM